MSSVAAVSPPRAQVIVVGGESYFVNGTIRKNLDRRGIDIVGHWYKVKTDAEVPVGTALLCLVDLCSHSIVNQAAEVAHRCGAPFLRGSRKWAFMLKALEGGGLLQPGSPSEPVEGEVEDPVTEPARPSGSSRVAVRSNGKAGHILEVSDSDGKNRRTFNLGHLAKDQMRLCHIGAIAMNLDKPSARGMTLDAIFDLARTAAKTYEEIQVRRELVVETLVQVGRRERESESPLLPNGRMMPSIAASLSAVLPEEAFSDPAIRSPAPELVAVVPSEPVRSQAVVEDRSGELRLLDCIEANPGRTNDELAALMGVSHQTVRNRLLLLREARLAHRVEAKRRHNTAWVWYAGEEALQSAPSIPESLAPLQTVTPEVPVAAPSLVTVPPVLPRDTAKDDLAEIVAAVKQLQILMRRRPDLLEMTIRPEGSPRILQQQVVEKDLF
jgi:hypothetical protein